MDKRFEFIIHSGVKSVFISLHDKDKDVIVSQVTLDMDGEYYRYKHFCNGDKIARIVRIETTPSYVGHGFGTKVMKKVLDYLDERGYNSYLLVSPQPRDVDKMRTLTDLRRFYSKFGFIKTRELLPTMFRKAK